MTRGPAATPAGHRVRELKLPKADVALFYELFHPLLVYANGHLKILKCLASPDDIKKNTLEDIVRVREALYKQPGLIERFIVENPPSLGPEKLGMVREWKSFVQGRFVILRELRDHTVFLSVDVKPERAYGVVGLNDDPLELLPPPPVMVETALLPFKGMIIYDSLISHYRIMFGGGIRGAFEDSYREAKTRFGIITSLPFTPEKGERSDAEKLRSYLSTERSRRENEREIRKLTGKSRDLLVLYHQEMGRIDSRGFVKKFRENDLGEGWFAILDGTIISSGPSREEAEKGAAGIVPEDKRDMVFFFRYPSK